MDSPTYIFGDDGTHYLYFNSRIVASSTKLEDLEKIAEDGSFNHQDLTPTFDPKEPKTDTDEPSDHKSKEDRQKKVEAVTETDDTAAKLKKATHVVTPGGVRGKIASKYEGLWGDRVTVRFDNGRVAHFDVVPELTLVNEQDEKTAASTPFMQLRAKLDEIPSGTRDSLVSRIRELKDIQHQAQSMMAGVGDVEAGNLHEVYAEAAHEIREAAEAIEAIDDAEPFIPVAPFAMHAAEQESMGGNDSAWLDNVVNDMLEEAESTDFDALMNEGPEVLVAEVNDGALEDAGGVRMLAQSFVQTKTAGLNPEAVSLFEKEFLARVEEVRQQEVVNRRAKMAKEASTRIEDFDGPAEELFL